MGQSAGHPARAVALALTDDPALCEALGQAAASCGSGGIEWLDPVPGRLAEPVDLLVVDRRTSRPLGELLKAVRPRPALVVLVLAAEAWADPALAADLADADEILLWPAPPATLAARWKRWMPRLRLARRQEKVEDRLARVDRENIRLRQQLDRHSRQTRVFSGAGGELRQLLARMEGMTRLSRQVNSLQLEEIVDLCIRRVPTLLGARLASLYFFDTDGDTLLLQRHNHPYPIDSRVSISREPLGPMARAVRHGHLLVINEPDWAKRLGEDVPRANSHRYATGNCVICPLTSRNGVVGVLNLADKVNGEPFDDVIDLIPIRQLCELLGASIRNIELYREVQRQARCDGMTGLANHSTFVEQLAREIHRATRYDAPLSLIMLDLDGLKVINDTLGHLAGDEALRLVAARIGESIRDSDLAARYGGDEFAILLPSTALAPARAVAQRIVDMLADSKISHAGGSHPITVSVGVGQFSPPATPEQFIGQVDSALYVAKHQGRNRIALHA
ncbi:MAG: hypothetical protein BIFFINMI_03179 [Phycisphaerae bacterium]|nr:hypothetical protein [Phycisphaerae bacterium]